jgi:DNA polymerase lambda
LPTLPSMQSRRDRDTIIFAHATPDAHTLHTVAEGPGWLEGRDRDGLDEIISGVQSGEVDDADEDDVNQDPLADKFKCGKVNDGTPKDGPNEWLACKFDEMLDMYSGAKHKNDFQVRGYMLGKSSNLVSPLTPAAAAIRRTTWPIRSGKDAGKIKGIGDGMQQRVS